MKKQPKRIRLSRETLHILEQPKLGAVVAAWSNVLVCTKNPTACGDTVCFSCMGTCNVTHCGCGN